jgi:hypothetical protein
MSPGITLSDKDFIKNAKFIEEVPGTRYGRLVIVERGANKRDGKTVNATWVCKCDCGNFITTRGASLRSGRTQSCGCIRTEWIRENHALPAGEAGRNKAVFTMKANAKRRNLEWKLSEDFVTNLITQNCHYCGREPYSTARSVMGDFKYNGIDRMDNTKGYTEDNVVPCCIICNESKRTKSVEEFLDMVRKIYNHSIVMEV